MDASPEEKAKAQRAIRLIKILMAVGVILPLALYVFLKK
jgi:hypothetical protein